MQSRDLIDILVNHTQCPRLSEDVVFADLEELKARAEKDGRLDRFDLWSNGKWVEMAAIRVKPEFRNQGVGEQWMREVLAVARKLNQPVILSPEPEPRHKADLQRFYRRLGFRPNRG